MTEINLPPRAEPGATTHGDDAARRERLHTALTRAGSAGAWEWTLADRRIVGDAAFAALYGISAETAEAGIPPARFFAAIHSDDRDRIRLAIGGMLRGAEIFSKEYRLVLGDGQVRWVQARGRSSYDAQDRPQRFSGILTDITEQKRVEERLRIAQTAGGVGTFEYVGGFGTVSTSAQFCNLLGLRPAPALPVRTINALVHPDDPPLIDLPGPDRPGPAAPLELRIRRSDTGEVRWLMRRGEHLRDAETAGIRFSGVIYDVTAAKRVEEQLRTLNETLETRVAERTRERDRMWRTSRDLYAICDADGRCESVNPAWASELGYHEDEVTDQPLAAFVHPADRPRLEAALHALGHGEEVEDTDVRMLARHGQDLVISWTFVPEGRAFFAAGRDITRRRQLEDQLRQSQKMEAVGQLTGGIAHDFNNLLTGITVSLDMLRRRIAQGRLETVDRLMEAAVTSAQRAAALTHRLLAFSRRQTLDVRPLDINAVVASMEDLLERAVGEQVAVRLALDDLPAFGLSDANQLENALLNLAINARDAMPDGGALTIATHARTIAPGGPAADQDLKPGAYVLISVSDTGTGMSPETRAKAFDPFFTTKPIGQGTGLGLSMVYGFAKQTGGHVQIDSALGRGTTVTMFVPQVAVFAPVEDAADAVPDLDSTLGETILIVEDDSSVRLLLTEMLVDLGYQVLDAADAGAALDLLRSPRPIDLMVSDVGLPDINGRNLADAARVVRPNLKVLFVTGYAANVTLRADFLGPGMDMIMKPFDHDVLAARVRAMLDQT